MIFKVLGRYCRIWLILVLVLGKLFCVGVLLHARKQVGDVVSPNADYSYGYELYLSSHLLVPPSSKPPLKTKNPSFGVLNLLMVIFGSAAHSASASRYVSAPAPAGADADPDGGWSNTKDLLKSVGVSGAR